MLTSIIDTNLIQLTGDEINGTNIITLNYNILPKIIYSSSLLFDYQFTKQYLFNTSPWGQRCNEHTWEFKNITVKFCTNL